MFNAIDVSKWQGAMNWATVKNAGVRHAMIRAGYGNSVRQTDPQFKRNTAQCIALGIDWGVYWYSYATSPEMARHKLGAATGPDADGGQRDVSRRQRGRRGGTHIDAKRTSERVS